ncbi:DUF881 domain-containing protein [Clostridium psychrophilum]|uniref:DUF881 domain-containing protein n=1 Tax=Clostridium psychrophilum TaxID=132926 RepID=UPI001C0AB4BB|nr:DUF881 domain-containing protein [Clostridium psychrophilum]MBU3180120.1 DUF881 domain-containing protein [Clostridium psychrophilum]
MKNNESTIFVFIASIIIGLLIAMNIGFKGKNNFLDIKQYSEAYNERTKLYSDLNNLKQQYYVSKAKLDKYNSGDEKNVLVTKEIEQEINENNLLLGKSDVAGPGVKITLQDGTNNFDDYPTMDQLIHDSDIVQVINDLRNAGAEAISVNGQRVVYNNYGLCAGSNIDLNGIKIVTPFYITAIGNEDVLYNYLTLEQTYITQLKTRDVHVNVVKQNKIQILAYNGKYIYKYIKLTEK